MSAVKKATLHIEGEEPQEIEITVMELTTHGNYMRYVVTPNPEKSLEELFRKSVKTETVSLEGYNLVVLLCRVLEPILKELRGRRGSND